MNGATTRPLMRTGTIMPVPARSTGIRWTRPRAVRRSGASRRVERGARRRRRRRRSRRSAPCSAPGSRWRAGALRRGARRARSGDPACSANGRRRRSRCRSRRASAVRAPRRRRAAATPMRNREPNPSGHRTLLRSAGIGRPRGPLDAALQESRAPRGRGFGRSIERREERPDPLRVGLLRCRRPRRAARRDASRTARSEPSSRSSARRLRGPMPPISSRIEVRLHALAQLALELDREAVRLVAHALEQQQPARCSAAAARRPCAPAGTAARP